MVDLTTISAAVELAKPYYLQLLRADTALLVSGCKPKSTDKLTCLKRTIRSLVRDIAYSVNNTNTQLIYDLLLTQIGNYTGTAMTYNPNVILPGTVINVTTTAPKPVDIQYTDLTLTGTRYDNTAWAGFNPFMILDFSTNLRLGIDYNIISTGGFILTNQIYPGQIITVFNYALI